MLKSFLLLLLLYTNITRGDLITATACKINNCVTKCQNKWELKDGHCYLKGTKELSWDDAEAYCQKEGGHLGSLEEQANGKGNFVCSYNLPSGGFFSLNIDPTEQTILQSAHRKQRFVIQIHRNKH